MGTITRSFANLITASGPSAVADGSISAADLESGVGGKVLQVVTATDSTQRTTTSATFVTGSNTLSATITPSSASNKIFVVVTTAGGQNTGDRSAKYDLRRDSTSIAELNCNDEANLIRYPIVISNLDSPNTTSAITYQLFFRTDGVGTVAINYAGTKGSITAFEIAG
jgi:hypothetical protein